MKTLEQLLTIGSCAGLGLLLTCTADNESKTNDSDTEYVSDDSGNDTDDSSSDSCVAWEQTFDGGFYDHIYSVQQTNDGGYVLAGATSIGEVYGWLLKTDADGNKQWEQTFGGSSYDGISAVQQTMDGGYILAGVMESSETMYDGWLVKTDTNGNKQWEQTFDGGSYDLIYFVQQTTDGGYVLAGFTGRGGVYGWLLKTDADGNKQWEQLFNNGDDERIYSVQQTNDEGYILAGNTESSGAGNYDGWLVKTDVDGNKQWEQTFGGSSDIGIFSSAQQTTDGGYVLAGYTNSSETESYDGWLIKTDKNGNKEWEQTFGGSGYDGISSVQQANDGGYVLAGATQSSGAGYDDGWLVKTDSDGTKQWEQTFGGSDTDLFYSVQQTTNGGYVLAGYTTFSGIGSDGWLIKACDK